MNNPQPSDLIGELNELLTDAIYISRRGDRTARQVKTEAHAAIERMIVEIIGEDEPDMRSNTHLVSNVTRNQLRAELRAKLSSLTQNTENGDK